MVPSLLTLVLRDGVIKTTASAASADKVDTMTILCFQLRYRHTRHVYDLSNSTRFHLLFTLSPPILSSVTDMYVEIYQSDIGIHYHDVIMGAKASQITSIAIVYSTDYSDADQRKHQSSASLAFVRGIHRGPVNSPHKWPVTRKMFLFDDVIMQIWMMHNQILAVS